MTTSLQFPAVLEGEFVNLIAMEQTHFTELAALANDKRIWEFYSYDASKQEKFKTVFDAAFVEKERGSHFPFSILHKAENKLIGSTRYIDIQPQHMKMEIGATWLYPDYWATAINLECKLLLLQHAFEQMNIQRIQLKTDVHNVRSQKAIEKIGGQYEGTFCNDMLRDDGTHRDSMYYSIIAQEWLQKKEKLQALFTAKKAADY